MKIGDEVFVHGYVDEIRNDVIIIRNDGGYFGTVADECYCYEEDRNGYGTMNEADTPQADDIGDCNICRFAGCSECDDCINGSEWVRETEIDEADTPQTESTGSPIGDYRDGVGAWQTDCKTCKHNGESWCGEHCYNCYGRSEYEPHTDCGWGEPG